MDDRLRKLERVRLAGDPEATEALLNAQRRLGMYEHGHFVVRPFFEILSAGGQRDNLHRFYFNFELHYIVAVSCHDFACSIEFITDPTERASLSDSPLHSINFSPQYKLLMPRFISKGSSVLINVTDLSLSSNTVTLEFHGIRTVTKEDK